VRQVQGRFVAVEADEQGGEERLVRQPALAGRAQLLPPVAVEERREGLHGGRERVELLLAHDLVEVRVGPR
jgi:hypothetical protein